MKQLDFLKKTILCGIVCLLTMNANAQGNYLLATGDTPTSGQVVTSVSNIIMTYGEDTYIAAKSYKNESDEDFTNYTSGAASPKVGIDLIPTSGTYYKFVPMIAGFLTIGVVQNALTSTKSGAVVVLEDGKDLNLTQQNASAKYYGTYSFTVKANSIYYVYIAGSKMGFYGFKFTVVGPSNDITNLSAFVDNKNPVYNLSGQRLPKKTRGICIQNGKKYIVK